MSLAAGNTPMAILYLARGEMAVVLKPTPRLVLTSPNRTENRDLVLFGDAVKNLANFLPQAYLIAKTATPEQLVNDYDNLYFETLSCYTAQTLQMKNTLSVSVYRGKASIWVKRMFFGQDTKSWHVCKGGFQIRLQDVDTTILDFLHTHMDVLKPNTKRKKETMISPREEDAASASATAATATAQPVQAEVVQGMLKGVAAQVAASVAPSLAAPLADLPMAPATAPATATAVNATAPAVEATAAAVAATAPIE